MKRKNHPWQALTLALITTFVAELFFGTTPVSRAFLLIPQLIYYGSASILIRELARRNQLRWTSVILLAIAFAWVEEGLTLQTFFNPSFVGTDLSYGRMNGVNVPWIIYGTGFHAFWSICTSLLLTELIFPQTAKEPWIGKAGVWVFGILFIAVCLGLHKQMEKLSGFNSRPVDYIVTFCVVLLLIIAAFSLSRSPRETILNKTNPGFWLVLITSFAWAASWQFGFFIHYILPDVSPWVDIALALVLLIIGGVLLKSWSGSLFWNNEKKVAMVTGLIMADLLMGYFITQSNHLDHVAHIVIIIITLNLLWVLIKKIKKDTVQTIG